MARDVSTLFVVDKVKSVRKHRNSFVFICSFAAIFSLHFQTSFAKINIHQSVKIGGIQQWIEIKSEKDDNPVLLFLHGGPGNSAMGYAHKFTSELRKHFIVVLWDQRETGKTLRLNPTNQPLSLSLMESDVKEMTDYVCTRFSKKKIYLMGHSWGGFLALRMAARYPEEVAACLAISPMIDQLASEKLSLEWMRAQAKKSNNLPAIAELSQIKVPFENASQIYWHRHWLAIFTGNRPPNKIYVEQWATRWLSAFNEASAINFRTHTPSFGCPVYLFIGEKDYQTHFSIAQDYITSLKAEKKELFWFKNSGHNLNLTEPKKLQAIIISLTHN